MTPPPRRWTSNLQPALIRWLRPLRRRRQKREQRLLQVDVHGSQHVREALSAGHGVLITPNHSTHCDAYAMYEASDAVGSPFYFMSTWHVFDSAGPVSRQILRWHGCFSVDREGTDMQAFRQAVKILQEAPPPLVIFPEGEVYHCNDRITPFREGPAVIALSAAKRANRQIVCIPCAMKYEYLDDPTPQLLAIMDELERSIFWRPRPQRSLPERIYEFAEAILALKEMEFLGQAGRGSLPERTDRLAQEILSRLESRHQVPPRGATIPERVKELRRRTLAQLEELSEGAPQWRQCQDDLDDLFLVVQLFSYPGDYVAERPSLERLAETLDKFEEDVLGKYSATVRGKRRGTVYFDEPIPVEPGQSRGEAARALTETLEQRVQAMLDQHNGISVEAMVEQPTGLEE